MDSRYGASGATRYSSPKAGEQEKVVSANPCNLIKASFGNTTGAAIFVWIFDGASSTDPIVPPIRLAANDSRDMYEAYPFAMQTSLRIGSSTSQTTYTAAGANSLQIFALYKG